MRCIGADQSSNPPATTDHSKQWMKMLGHPPRMLIVEDNLGILTSLTEWFEGEGWEVTGVIDGTAFFAAVEATIEDSEYALEYDCIITDISMSGIDVLAILEAMRVTDCQIPVAVISGLSDPMLPRQIEQLGMARFLRKPFRIANLNQEVCRLMRCALDDRTIG